MPCVDVAVRSAMGCKAQGVVAPVECHEIRLEENITENHQIHAVGDRLQPREAGFRECQPSIAKQNKKAP